MLIEEAGVVQILGRLAREGLPEEVTCEKESSRG